jgi:hypothetical protein
MVDSRRGASPLERLGRTDVRSRTFRAVHGALEPITAGALTLAEAQVRVQYRRITNVLAATVTDNTARVVGTLVGDWKFNPPPKRRRLAGEVLIAIA